MGSSPAKRAFVFATATHGRLAQVVRASVLHTEGLRFESSIAHHSPSHAKGVSGPDYWAGSSSTSRNGHIGIISPR